jgi:hypothetical protein
MTTNYLQAFNDHFMDFVNDIQSVFPDDHDLLIVKNSFITIRKANPKLIVKIWNTYIVSKYKTEIENGNIRFFIEKDYSQDINGIEHSDKIMEGINRLREPIKNMSKESQEKTMKYIQNLSKLSSLVCN